MKSIFRIFLAAFIFSFLSVQANANGPAMKRLFENKYEQMIKASEARRFDELLKFQTPDYKFTNIGRKVFDKKISNENTKTVIGDYAKFIQWTVKVNNVNAVPNRAAVSVTQTIEGIKKVPDGRTLHMKNVANFEDEWVYQNHDWYLKSSRALNETTNILK